MKYILFFFIILFVSFADRFLYRIGIIPFSPAYFLVPLSFVCFIVTFKVQKYFIYLKTHSFKFLLAIVILSLLFSLNQSVSFEVMLQAIVSSSISLLLYSFCLILFAELSSQETRFFLFLGLIVISVSIWYDMFIGLPITDIELINSARKGGFAENPNVAASSVKFLGLILLLLHPEKKMRMIMLTITLATVFITFSRSGLLSVTMLMVFLSLNEWKVYFNLKVRRLFLSSIKMLLLFAFFYALLLVFADIIREEVPVFREGAAAERLDLLTGKSDGGVISKDDTGSLGRKTLVSTYLNSFYEQPFGSGTGYCADKTINLKNTHNYYLRIAVEFGVIGLFIFLYFLYKSARLAYLGNNFYYLVFLILIAFECMISHYLFDEKPIIVALALLDAHLYYKDQDNEEPDNSENLLNET